MRSLSWYIKRASVMHPREVFHRIGEHVVLARLRREHRFGETRPKEVERPNDFQFCTETSDQLPALSWNFDPTDDRIHQLLQGQWSALGFPWKWEPDSHLWSRAPDTGKAWPSIFFGSIPYHAGNPFGDIRVAWEPSRLQQLVSLALLVRQDAAHAEQAIGLLENILASWIAANPPLTGIHYVSAMECALRLIAACHAVDLVRMRLRTQERTQTNLLQLVASHAPLIAKRLSLYSSAGNHTIAEGCGLVYAGTLFPEFSGASEWKSIGMRILAQESARQILPDGGGIEQALGYQLFIIDLLGLVQALLEHHAESVPATIANAVRKGRAFRSPSATARTTCLRSATRMGDMHCHAICESVGMELRIEVWLRSHSLTPGTRYFAVARHRLFAWFSTMGPWACRHALVTAMRTLSPSFCISVSKTFLLIREPTPIPATQDGEVTFVELKRTTPLS